MDLPFFRPIALLSVERIAKAANVHSAVAITDDLKTVLDEKDLAAIGFSR
jgi:hypothetical protein